MALVYQTAYIIVKQKKTKCPYDIMRYIINKANPLNNKPFSDNLQKHKLGRICMIPGRKPKRRLKSPMPKRADEFIRTVADGTPPIVAARLMGYKAPAQEAQRFLANSEVNAEITKRELARINNDLLPTAINTLKRVMEDENAPAGARVNACKVVLDRAFGANADSKQKELHEMTAEEIQAAIDKLRREASERATPITVIEATPTPSVLD